MATVFGQGTGPCYVIGNVYFCLLRNGECFLRDTAVREADEEMGRKNLQGPHQILLFLLLRKGFFRVQ